MKQYKYRLFLLIMAIVAVLPLQAASLLIPMDKTQTNHLKSYGLAFWVLQQGVEIEWLLNYRGGSYLIPYHEVIENECVVRNVSYEVVSDVQASTIKLQIAEPDVNMEVMQLHKVPKIAVYSPKNKQPWDDAVTLALTYAEIPYEIVYDEEVITGLLPTFDWLHLHHEDFTGQYGKFWSAYRAFPWYQEDVRLSEEMAKKLGFSKVSDLKLAVAKKIQEFVVGGGYLFAMCSATDSYDVAMAADQVDICDVMFDGDPMNPNAQSMLNYNNCVAFQDFTW